MPTRFIRKIPILFLLLPLFLAGQAIFEKDFFHFSLWFFAFLILWAAVYPVLSNMKKETVPVFQIFFSLVVFIFIFSALFFFEFSRVGFGFSQSFLYGIFMGIIVVGVIMILKGE